jgi:ribulose-phosphate 3-epimerase
MNRPIFIAPSILSANFSHLEKAIRSVESLHAKYLHIDVMDGHFVPNISIGVPVLQSIARIHNMINDVHLMISEPQKFITPFIQAGADIITFHLEACSTKEEVMKCIQLIQKHGKKVGLSIKPNTPVNELLPYLSQLDLALIMSVEPGFGGQAFIPSSLEKIKRLRQTIDQQGYRTLIEVDGGINEMTAQACVEAGVDILVAGSYLFGHDDISERYHKLLRR